MDTWSLFCIGFLGFLAAKIDSKCAWHPPSPSFPCRWRLLRILHPTPQSRWHHHTPRLAGDWCGFWSSYFVVRLGELERKTTICTLVVAVFLRFSQLEIPSTHTHAYDVARSGARPVGDPDPSGGSRLGGFRWVGLGLLWLRYTKSQRNAPKAPRSHQNRKS